MKTQQRGNLKIKCHVVYQMEAFLIELYIIILREVLDRNQLLLFMSNKFPV